MIMFSAKSYREILHTTLYVIDPWLMMIGYYALTNRFNLPIVLGGIVGSAASILNYVLNVSTVHISMAFDPKKAISIILVSKIIRAFILGLVAFTIFLSPVLHVTTGIIAMFFIRIRDIVIRAMQNWPKLKGVYSYAGKAHKVEPRLTESIWVNRIIRT